MRSLQKGSFYPQRCSQMFIEQKYPFLHAASSYAKLSLMAKLRGIFQKPSREAVIMVKRGVNFDYD